MANRTIVALEQHAPVPEQPPLTGLRAQFAHPRGVWGSLVGHIMALANARANQWLLEQLEVRPTDRVLDIGSGPGVGVKLATRLAYDGVAIGIDPSETMLRQAIRRNASLISDGKVELHLAPASSIPFHDAFVDRIMSFNTIQFVDDLDTDLREMHRVLRPSGRIAIGLQPRGANITPRTAHAWGDLLKVAMRSAGFVDLKKTIAGPPDLPIVAVGGRKPVALASIQ
jgi:SAM-dependent methyltransferase